MILLLSSNPLLVNVMSHGFLFNTVVYGSQQTANNKAQANMARAIVKYTLFGFIFTMHNVAPLNPVQETKVGYCQKYD